MVVVVVDKKSNRQARKRWGADERHTGSQLVAHLSDDLRIKKVTTTTTIITWKDRSKMKTNRKTSPTKVIFIQDRLVTSKTEDKGRGCNFVTQDIWHTPCQWRVRPLVENSLRWSKKQSVEKNLNVMMTFQCPRSAKWSAIGAIRQKKCGFWFPKRKKIKSNDDNLLNQISAYCLLPFFFFNLQAVQEFGTISNDKEPIDKIKIGD